MTQGLSQVFSTSIVTRELYPDGVLMDIRMPQMDGLVAAARI